MTRLLPPLRVALVTLLVSAVACSDFDDEVAATGNGEPVFRNPIDEGNSFACNSCHALDEPAEDGFRRPGHPLGEATRRASYKNGQLTNMLDAVNTCLTEWMNVPAPWTEDEPRWTALFNFLDRQATADAGTAPVVVSTIAPPPTDMATLLSGDFDRGRTLFDGSCAVCHGVGGAGSIRAPNLVGVGIAPDVVAKRVRTSGLTDSSVYNGLTGGKMPFWAADRLSDAELLDIVAWVSMSQLPTDTPDVIDDVTADVAADADVVPDIAPEVVADIGPDTSAMGPCEPNPACGQTHAHIGWVAELETFNHGVRGTATVIDDCTICLEAFYFDGAGVNVQVYGARGGDYKLAGFSLSGDLKNFPVGYSDDTLRLDIPAGKTLDDIDGISIWCVPVGVSFGDGLFAP